MSPAEERAAREGMPVVRLVPFECMRIAYGNPMVTRAADGTEMLVRLFTPDELLAAHAEAVGRLAPNEAPTMSRERAEELTRPIGGDAR